ncbi:MAG TPA: hypothetical protein VK673_21740 [Chthoniobacterales bacterium]|nr:hypothetical protein [Chthoniobacterales bacterium]
MALTHQGEQQKVQTMLNRQAPYCYLSEDQFIGVCDHGARADHGTEVPQEFAALGFLLSERHSGTLGKEEKVKNATQENRAKAKNFRF